MSKPIEFSDFYRLLTEVKRGDQKKKEELDWLLAEYEHAKGSEGAYDELGQIFCHIGVMELYEYTGVDNITFISKIESSIWDYLIVRVGEELDDYLVKKMVSHCENHNLAEKISKKWDFPEKELIENIKGLAVYVAQGIVEVVK